MNIKRLIENIKNIFSEKKSWAILLITAVVFYEINIIISNFGNFGFISESLGFSAMIIYFFNVSLGFLKAIPLSSAFTLALLSVMTGMLIAVLVYRNGIMNDKTAKKGKGFLGSLGIFFGILAPGCASCGIGLIAILGLGTSIASLPFKGLEISVLAVLILGFSILKVSEKIGVCEIPKQRNKFM